MTATALEQVEFDGFGTVKFEQTAMVVGSCVQLFLWHDFPASTVLHTPFGCIAVTRREVSIYSAVPVVGSLYESVGLALSVNLLPFTDITVFFQEANIVRTEGFQFSICAIAVYSQSPGLIEGLPASPLMIQPQLINETAQSKALVVGYLPLKDYILLHDRYCGFCAHEPTICLRQHR